jgi:mRNA-degrading endonuclease RelE of RelBE toxin-antitoxin system
MQVDPFQGDIKRLKGQSAAWRRRVGSYRIIYDLYFEGRVPSCHFAKRTQ